MLLKQTKAMYLDVRSVMKTGTCAIKEMNTVIIMMAYSRRERFNR